MAAGTVCDIMQDTPLIGFGDPPGGRRGGGRGGGSGW